MYIKIKDEQGLGLALTMAGYPEEQRIWARDVIRELFGETARRVFQDVLGMPLPESIEVNTALNDNDELEGEKVAHLASYNLRLSKENHPVFTIREICVKELLDGEDIKSFESTTVHEMFHAADQLMLYNDYQLFQMLRKRIRSSIDYAGQRKDDQSIALLQALRMFNHYRAEGLAVLGESLLQNNPISLYEQPIERFHENFMKTIMKSCNIIEGKENEFDTDDIKADAYKDAPFVLLFALGKLGYISDELVKKTIEAVAGGNYVLTAEEVQTIMRAALVLSLSDFIEGLILSGDHVAPIMSFLFFCQKLQSKFQYNDNSDASAFFQLKKSSEMNELERRNIEVFDQLVQQPNSVDNFINAMDQIMGCCIPEDELDDYYKRFIDSLLDNPAHPKMKEKVSFLYSIFKTDNNPDRKRLAQWALTYFFDDEDLIHDDISCIGYVDDMLVMNYAINLLQ